MVSDYTRRTCALLCVEKAFDMESARLADKLKIMTEQNCLSEAQKRIDDERRAEAGRLFEIARDTEVDLGGELHANR